MSQPCRTCGAPVIWFPTPSGGRMPLDPAPVEGGNVVVISGQAVVVKSELEGRLVTEAESLRYVSHFATCPQADDHRVSRTAAGRRRGSPAPAGATGGVGGQPADGPRGSGHPALAPTPLHDNEGRQ